VGSIPPKTERSPAKFDSFVKAEIARCSPILKRRMSQRSEVKAQMRVEHVHIKNETTAGHRPAARTLCAIC